MEVRIGGKEVYFSLVLEGPAEGLYTLVAGSG